MTEFNTEAVLESIGNYDYFWFSADYISARE